MSPALLGFRNVDDLARAVETLVIALKPLRNWYLDLANERNINDKRHAGIEELKQLRGNWSDERRSRSGSSRPRTPGDIPLESTLKILRRYRRRRLHHPAPPPNRKHRAGSDRDRRREAYLAGDEGPRPASCPVH